MDGGVPASEAVEPVAGNPGAGRECDAAGDGEAAKQNRLFDAGEPPQEQQYGQKEKRIDQRHISFIQIEGRYFGNKKKIQKGGQQKCC